jgi:hypothetical protein
VASLDNILNSDEISNRLKKILNQLITEGGKKSIMKSPHKGGADSGAMALETPHSSGIPLNLNTSSSSSSLQFFKQEKPYRIQSRTLHLEKISDKIPLFIKESVSYGKFVKNSSFENLSQLLDEVFHKGATLATQSYSPTVIDQLSQDSIIEKTSNFLIELFKDQFTVFQTGSNKNSYSDVKNLAQLSTKMLQQNFDYGNSESYLKGVSFFLFGKINQVFSQNVNNYYIMERIIGQIFEKSRILHLEFLLILSLMTWARDSTTTRGG